MSDMRVNMIGSGRICFSNGVDAEWQEIINKLAAYGYKSTKSRTGDRELLHSLEVENVKLESTVSSKFLTVSKNEQEKILEKKYEKRTDNHLEQCAEQRTGAKALGEQVYLAIQMKNKKKKV